MKIPEYICSCHGHTSLANFFLLSRVKAEIMDIDTSVTVFGSFPPTVETFLGLWNLGDGGDFIIKPK